MPRSSGRKVRQSIWHQATTPGYFYGVTMSLQRGFMISQHSSLLQYINLSAISWVTAKRNFLHLATREGSMKIHGKHNRIPLLLWRGETYLGKLSGFTPLVDRGKWGSGNTNPAAGFLTCKRCHVDFRAQQCWIPGHFQQTWTASRKLIIKAWSWKSRSIQQENLKDNLNFPLIAIFFHLNLNLVISYISTVSSL